MNTIVEHMRHWRDRQVNLGSDSRSALLSSDLVHQMEKTYVQLAQEAVFDAKTELELAESRAEEAEARRHDALIKIDETVQLCVSDLSSVR